MVHQLVVAFPAKSAERFVPPVAAVTVTAAYTRAAPDNSKNAIIKTNHFTRHHQKENLEDVFVYLLVRLLNQKVMVKKERYKKECKRYMNYIADQKITTIPKRKELERHYNDSEK